MAGFPVSHMRILLVGTMINSNVAPSPLNGIATPDVPIPVGRQMDADQFFGKGSELACMFRSSFANNFSSEIWALPVGDSSSTAQAQTTITVAAAATDYGTIHLYIAGYVVRVNVAATDTVNNI